MHTALSDIVKEAFEIESEDFCELVEETTGVLAEETGHFGNLEVNGRFAELSPQGKALVIGDIHGDLESLVDIFKQSHIMQRMNQSANAFLIFLGDYGDRGPLSAEVYYTILNLKLLFPKQVILMRGNHEGPDYLMANPHDLPEQFKEKFREKWEPAYAGVRKLSDFLYVAVLVEARYLLVHGGLPSEAKTIQDFAHAHSPTASHELLEELLWNDPLDAGTGVKASPRGAGKLFGADVTASVLEAFNAKVLIRGHEPCQDGYKIDQDGRILTLFSRKGPPYSNAKGAYLDVDLGLQPENAAGLVPYIHTF